MRPQNIVDKILPQLLKEPVVSKVIIAHGNPDTVFGVDGLADGEIRQMGSVWHVGDYKANTELRCFRRWELIYRLRKEGLLQEECILVQDDDIVFKEGSLSQFVKMYTEKKGVLISGSTGRNIMAGKYSYTCIHGKCNITIGQSIFGNIDRMCAAVEQIHTLQIPKSYLHEDDISMSYFTVYGSDTRHSQHYAVDLPKEYLPEPYALWHRPNHKEHRDRTVMYLLGLDDTISYM